MAASFLSLTVGPRTYELPKHNLAATVPPTAGDDDADGYGPGSTWINGTGETAHICVKNTTGGGVWIGVGGTTYTDEQAQDAVAAAFAAGSHNGVTVTYNDASNSLSIANTDKGSDAVSTHVAESNPHTQYQLTSAKGSANGYASLDSSGKIPQSQLPAIALQEFLGAVGSESAMLALSGERGDWCTRTDTGSDWQLIAEPSSTLGNWRERTYPASPVTSVAGRTGPITLTIADIGGLGTAAAQPSSAFQSADATLTSLAGFNSNGLMVQTSADTFTARAITGTTNRVAVTNGDGIGGNPTIDIHSGYVGQSSITTLGTVTTGTWNANTIDVARGGTGLTSYAVGDLLYASATTTIARLAAAVANNVLLSGASPNWGKVTNSHLADVATAIIKGRTTAGTGAVEDLTAAQATALLNAFVASGGSSKKGLVPDPGGTAGTTRFLREDATWVRPIDYILLQEQQTAGTNGGTFTAGAPRVRQVAEIVDTGNHCSVSVSRFELAAGTYIIYAKCPAARVVRHQAWLRNITDSTDQIYGSTEYAGSGSTDPITSSIIVGTFSFATTKSFEIWHQCSTTASTFGFGIAANIGIEVYTSVVLFRIG